MKRLAILALLALTSCTTVRYQRVYCVTPEQLQQLKDAKPDKIRDQLTGRADKDIGIVTGRLIRVEAWGDGLIDILGGCAGR